MTYARVCFLVASLICGLAYSTTASAGLIFQPLGGSKVVGVQSNLVVKPPVTGAKVTGR